MPYVKYTLETVKPVLLAKIAIDADGCWLWTGTINENGYGKLIYRGRQTRAHRVSHEAFKGPIPVGLDVDHLCHDPLACNGGKMCKHRRCINPDHLKAATRKDNLNRGAQPDKIWKARKAITHCPSGHAYTEYNTIKKTRGDRQCRECCRVRSAAYNKKKAEKKRLAKEAQYGTVSFKSSNVGT